MFIPFTVMHGTMVHFMTVFLNSMAQVQSVEVKAVFAFVGDGNAHQSKWLKSVSPTDRHLRDALDVCNLSGCEQFCHISVTFSLSHFR